MNIKNATIHDAKEISDLLNISYRGHAGWTNESKIVKGPRCSELDITNKISNQSEKFMVYKTNNRIIGCFSINISGDEAIFGSFAVHPEHQNSGIGNNLINQAEIMASNDLNCKKMTMHVIQSRAELIYFYERRGYLKTDKTYPFPINESVGTPVSNNVNFIELTKELSK